MLPFSTVTKLLNAVNHRLNPDEATHALRLIISNYYGEFNGTVPRGELHVPQAVLHAARAGAVPRNPPSLLANSTAESTPHSTHAAASQSATTAQYTPGGHTPVNHEHVTASCDMEVDLESRKRHHTQTTSATK